MTKKTRIIEATYPIDALSAEKFQLTLTQDKDTGQLTYIMRYVEQSPTQVPKSSYKDMKGAFARLFERPTKIIVHAEELTNVSTDSSLDSTLHLTEGYFDNEESV